MSTGPIAEATETANEQHYELPAEFFGLFLGPRRKYSGCLWADGVRDLAGAEEAMLALTCARAGIAGRDGHPRPRLRLGLAVAVARRAVPGRARSSASPTRNGQREWIEAEAARRGLANLEIRTAGRQRLRARAHASTASSRSRCSSTCATGPSCCAASRPGSSRDGRLFVHVFSQRRCPTCFEGTWAAERFFTAGLMPSHDLMALLPARPRARASAGSCRARTTRGRCRRGWTTSTPTATRRCASWAAAAPPPTARRLLGTWRLFLISTDEIWEWRGGDEWLVSHYLLAPRTAPRT